MPTHANASTIITGPTQTQSEEKAIKQLKEQVENTVEIMKSIDHPGVVKLIGRYDAQDTTYLIMEYANGRTLWDYIKDITSITQYGSHDQFTLFRRICKVVAHLHSKNIFHLDLTPHNIIVTPGLNVKLIDFGVAKSSRDKTGKAEGYSQGYAPAEALNQTVYGIDLEKFDIYSLGAILYYILTGKTPADAFDISTHGFNAERLRFHNVPDHIIAYIEKAMCPIANKRLQSVTEFLKVIDKPDLSLKPKLRASNISWEIRDDTSLVVIKFNTFRMFRCHYTIITPGGVNFDITQPAPQTTRFFSKQQYQKFLSDLQSLSLRTRNAWIKEELPSEPSPYLQITLYDKIGDIYNEYWVTGFRNEEGNLDGDPDEIFYQKLVKIIPGYEEFTSKDDYKRPDIHNALINPFINPFPPLPVNYIVAGKRFLYRIEGQAHSEDTQFRVYNASRLDPNNNMVLDSVLLVESQHPHLFRHLFTGRPTLDVTLIKSFYDHVAQYERKKYTRIETEFFDGSFTMFASFSPRKEVVTNPINPQIATNRTLPIQKRSTTATIALILSIIALGLSILGLLI